MKPVIALDLSLFAVPSTADSTSEVEEILWRIRAWASAMDAQNCVSFVTLSDAVDMLVSANCFPATHHIRALLQLHDLEHVFSANDVNTRLMSILQKAERFSDIVGLEVVELEACDINGADVGRSPDLRILKSLACLLASVAMVEQRDIIRVTSAFPSDDVVTLTAKITRLEQSGELEAADVEVKGSVHVVNWPEEYLSSLDPQAVWQNAEEAAQLHLAVSLEIAHSHGLSAARVPLEGVPRFSIGTEFLSTCKIHGALSSTTLGNIVRQKCAQVLLSQSQASPRPFNQARPDDKADSFRVHLTKDHEAFRLMYWRCQDGLAEFANIGPKHELMIRKGDIKSAAIARFNDLRDSL